MASPTTPAKDSWRDSPSAWFVALEAALRRGDYDAAADAAKELRRLGVTVTYAPCAEPRRAVTHE